MVDGRGKKGVSTEMTADQRMVKKTCSADPT